MNKTQKTIQFLVRYNAWRRGDETVEMPAPDEIGAAIDDAISLLKKQSQMEVEMILLRKNTERLEFLFKNMRRGDEFDWIEFGVPHHLRPHGVIDEAIAKSEISKL